MRNKKLAVLVLTIIIVLFAAVFLYPQIKKAYVGDTVRVLVASKDIGDGMVLSKEMFIEQEMPADYVGSVEDYVKVEELETERFAKQIILKGEPLIHRKITTDEELVLYSEQNLLGVSVESIASVVGAKISVGDYVTVRGFMESNETGEKVVVAPEELRKVEVAYITDSDAKDKKENFEEKTEEKTDSTTTSAFKEEEKFIPKTVVFKVKTNEQATKLIELEYSTKIHLERLSERRVKELEEAEKKAEEERKKAEEEKKKEAEGAGQ